MKAVLKSFALALVVSLVACKKEDGDDTTSNPSGDLKSNIQGSWEVTANEQRNGEMTTMGMSMGTFESTGNNFVGEIVFNADGTYSSNIGYDVEMIMNIQVQGLPTQVDTITQTVPQANMTGEYVVTNKTLTMTQGDTAELSFDVKSFSSSTLELETVMDTVMMQQGVEVGTKYDYYMALKKK